jgi:hypothetical protein
MRTFEIAQGHAVQVYRYRPVVDSDILAEEPESATITITSPDGATTLVDAQDMDFNATTGELTYSIDTTDATAWATSDYYHWPLDFFYNVHIEFQPAVEDDDPPAAVEVDDLTLAVVLSTWRPGATGSDILAIDASAAMFLPTDSDWTDLINEAVESVYVRCAAERPAITPGMVKNRAELDRYVKYRTLANFWARHGVEKDQYDVNNLHLHYTGLCNESWIEAMRTAYIDKDQDGVIDENPDDRGGCWAVI